MIIITTVPNKFIFLKINVRISDIAKYDFYGHKHHSFRAHNVRVSGRLVKRPPPPAARRVAVGLSSCTQEIAYT